MPNKREAIRRLRAAGHASAAEALEVWRSENGKNQGWDGFFGRAFPELREVVGLPKHSHSHPPSERGTARMNGDGRPPLSMVTPPATPGTRLPSLPDVIIHADWSKDPDGDKRQVVYARRCGERYLLSRARPAGPNLLEAAFRCANAGGSVLAGFDFAIGVPVEFARAACSEASAAGLDLGNNFLDFIRRVPQSFFIPQNSPVQASWCQPFFPDSNAGWEAMYRRGIVGKGAKHRWLSRQLLGRVSATPDMLLREAERAHGSRPRASPVFLLSGSQQVGKASIAGWREVIVPSLEKERAPIRFWPFEGPLHSLVDRTSVTLVETYPADCYGHLGFRKPAKRNPAWRKLASDHIRRFASERGVLFSEGLTRQMEMGFGPGKEGEDPFDAMVGAVLMVLVVLGHVAAGDPSSHDARTWEGWILGRPVPTPSPLPT